MFGTHPIFADRAEAGRLLAEPLARLELAEPVIYALPRGGVPVAVEVARVLRAPLELVLVRKLGAPANPELAIGAVVESGDGDGDESGNTGDGPVTILNDAIAEATGADPAYVEDACERALAEIARRRAAYLGVRPRLDPAGRTAVVVDDGLATGATMKAALTALRRQGAAAVVAAVPVAPADALDAIRALSDHLVCLHPARHFRGVGAFYSDFRQLTDDETVRQLRAFRDSGAGGGRR
ncbi:phosphoribosyltransferase [Rhodobacteraceae bacterium 2CG4]|uniref:Phosphoribosyltransferase n=2 Tax=Halovulum marinum TaxID=2662447 RepID=A0A6L5YW95_9RHOB|nr:phosphoribosyltransferase [Halovulum marinum]